MPRFNQPCNGCGILTRNGSLCENCATERQRRKDRARQGRPERYAKKARLYNYAYQQEAKRIKANATHCHICSKPFTETDKIEADHIFPGDPNSPLLPAHRLCNQRRGNKPIEGIA